MKTQKRPYLTPERSETPVSQVGYFIRCELHTCFPRTTEKMKNHPPQAPQVPQAPHARQSLSPLHKFLGGAPPEVKAEGSAAI